MSDLANIDPKTGELLDFQPANPVELEYVIRELGERLENAVPVIKGLWEERYKKEHAYIEARAKALMAAPGPSVTEKRAQADLATLVQLQEFQDAKAILHAAEELQKALRAKLSGFQSISKSVNAAYGTYGRQ